ncbi:hypothetical protein N0V82_010282 [Gnomoniopsis sp. IMI 355080]|nr:hypothetical protein N0V82_010282 [Gnomoniopsis sp. IMI 355080]
MLGHLRFHRRGQSNPSSPIPEQLSPFDHAEHPSNVQDIGVRPDFLPRPSNPSNTPPIHPSSTRPDGEPAPNRKASEQSLRDVTSPNVSDSSFMGGIALRRKFEANRQDSLGSNSQSTADKGTARAKPVPPPINTNLPSTRPPPIAIKEVKHASSFVAPTDPQNRAVPTGKRPAGTRLTSEPPSLAAAAQAVVETQRAKKGLPFLKNSMSGLLLRRKASQNAPDLQTLPLPRKPGETKYEPIRGTRVHDFSAPRKRVVPTRQPSVPGIQASTEGDLPLRVQTGVKSNIAPDASPEGQQESDSRDATKLSKEPSNTSARTARKISLDDKPLPADPPVATSATVDQAEPTHSTSTKSRPISAASFAMRANPSNRTNKSRHISLSDDAVSLSALPKHMKSTSSRFSFDMKGVSEAAMAEKVLEERHRQKELERKANGDSSHRDSRYDDFDEDAFDYDAAMMDDGLEEEIPEVNADYDENDYLQEEDPFEEDIPMVGDNPIIVEEAEEDQNDPDNDQENFAGFVFTRSNPHSSLVSPATPGVLSTPRDAVGRPIGYAFTKDGTPMLGPATSPLPAEDEVPEKQDADVSLAGLGIQGLDAPPTTQYDPTVFQERRNLPLIDDMEKGQDKGLYYDGGLLEELQLEAGEIQESQFDENLFDLDDVDEFGRPLPGVFRQNLDMRTKAQEHKKRDSDMTSPPSEASESTAHTSVSVGMHPVVEEDPKDNITATSLDEALANCETQKPSIPATSLPQANDDQAYQMALFEGVQKAAASGWKSRWAEDEEEVEGESTYERNEHQPTQASPSGDCDVTITSPTTASQPSTAGLGVGETIQPDDYDDDNYAFDNDDDDFYDEDFIAEANAEALAYDDEGFYGTEFGFYSAPPPARPHDDSSTGGGIVYGGYFGPSGALQRGLSTRNVLREPNLTPITEMSEYSNRNSMLSMGGLPSATLADFRSPHMEDFDYTLGGLQRLRGKTFGGSQISLSSSRDGSPRSERAPLHSERFETTSPMPWDMARAQLAADSPTVAGGFPPQPLFSPPPPPSPGRPQCFPVLEEDAESGSPGGRTVKNTPADSEAELSPSETYERTTGEESSMSSFDTPAESPALTARLGEEERTVLHERLVLPGRDIAVPVET